MDSSSSASLLVSAGGCYDLRQVHPFDYNLLAISLVVMCTASCIYFIVCQCHRSS